MHFIHWNNFLRNKLRQCHFAYDVHHGIDNSNMAVLTTSNYCFTKSSTSQHSGFESWGYRFGFDKHEKDNRNIWAGKRLHWKCYIYSPQNKLSTTNGILELCKL